MPSVGRVGDPMPFYDKKAGNFKVFYLQEFDNNMSHRFHPIWGVTTQDGTSYQSMGEVLPYGANDYTQDAALTACPEGTHLAANSVSEAMALLSGDVQILFLDIEMPGGSGIDLARTLNRIIPTIMKISTAPR